MEMLRSAYGITSRVGKTDFHYLLFDCDIDLNSNVSVIVHMEYAIPLLSSLILGLSMGGAAYVLLKRYIDTLVSDLQEYPFQLVQSEDGQKLFYSVGALIGNGAKGGFGLTKGSGKFKIEDLVMGIAGNFIQSKFGVPEQATQMATQMASDGAQPVSKLKSKF